MKNFIFGLFVLCFTFVACKKEVTFDEQLIGEWTSTSVKVGGTDASDANKLVITIEASREFDADITTTPIIGTPVTSSYTGDWSADELKQELILKYSNGEEEKYDITLLTDNTMKAATVVNNVRREFVFEKTTIQ